MAHLKVKRSPFLKRKGLLKGDLGLFANKPFKAKENVGEYEGKRLTKKEADLCLNRSYQINVKRSDTVIDAMSGRCALRYTNSADFDTEQNCIFVQRKFRVFLITTRDVKKGEELLAYYNHD